MSEIDKIVEASVLYTPHKSVEDFELLAIDSGIAAARQARTASDLKEIKDLLDIASTAQQIYIRGRRFRTQEKLDALRIKLLETETQRGSVNSDKVAQSLMDCILSD